MCKQRHDFWHGDKRMNAPLPSSQRLLLDDISLDDKYALERGRVFMTGIQALIRLPMLQRQHDLQAGLNTAGYVTGYRGSPLGTVDQTAAKAKKYLDAAHVKFHPGMNEDLAATAVWGTQQVNLFPGAQYDGVFSLWYGKGPAWIAAATSSNTPTWPAPRSTAAY